MMEGFFDRQDLAFCCPRCKKEFQTTVARLKRPDQECPHCGAKFETSDFKRGIDQAEDEIERFRRNLENLKIDIKLTL
jgi:transcription initiation factor IIE alpha subunit